MRSSRLALGVLAVAVMASACGADDDGPTATTPETATLPDVSLVTVPPSGSLPVVPETGGLPVEPEPTPTAQAAIDDLAADLDVDPSEVVLVSEENVTWPDGSIGCPEPGVGYTQVLTDGVRIVLEVDGTRYEYHAGGGSDAFLCEDPQPPVGG